MYGVDDALLVAGLAATVAGTGMGIAGNEEAQAAMSSVRTAERKRQDELQNEANSVFKKSLSTSGADMAKNKIAQGANQRQSVYNALKQVAEPIAGAPLPEDSNANPIVGDDATAGAARRARARGGAWSALNSEAAAREGGYQDYEAEQALNNAEASRRLAVINNRARGWAGIMPTELEVASHKGDALSGWGQLVSALGSTAGMAGAVGVGSGAAAPTMVQMNAAADPTIITTPAAEYNPGAWSSILQRTA
jgi:hypothetical protein